MKMLFSSLWLRIAVVFLGTVGSTLLLQSSFITDLFAVSFVGPKDMDASPFLVLGVFLILYVWSLRAEAMQQWAWPRAWQMLTGGVLFIVAVTSAYVATHPTPDRFFATHAFIQRYPDVGGPLLYGALTAMLLLPALPLLFALLPLPLLYRTWGRLCTGIIIFLLYLHAPVFEASYYGMTGPFLIRMVRGMLAFLGQDMQGVGRWELQYGSFIVSFGYACSEYASVVLYGGLFGVLWWRAPDKRRMSALRIVGVLLGGILLLWLLNIARIVGIMLVGSFSPEMAMTLFHSVMGTLLFFIFFLCYLPALRFAFRPVSSAKQMI